MNLRIEEIRYKNIREFGDLRLDFTRGDSNETYHVSLVQMPNGTGKTTTMGLIRHLILGTDLEEDQVRDYAPEYGASEGEFAIGFATPDQRFRLYMHLNYDMGTVRYRHSYPQREGGGANTGHYLPMDLDDAFTESFVDLFIFNGELTDSFIQTDEDKAESALKTVSRLDRIEAQQASIERVVEKRQENGQGARTEQGLKQNKTVLEKQRSQLKKLKSERSSLEDEISQQELDIENLQAERKGTIAENKEVLDRYSELEEKINEYRSGLHSEVAGVLGEMRQPSRLSEGFNDDFAELLKHMTILQLPKSTSEEFFNELADSDICICGRELSDEHREAIKENADEYLSDEDIGVLNTLKERLRNVPDVTDFDAKFENLQETRSNLTHSEMEQDGLDLDDPELERKKQKITEDIEAKKSARDENEEILELLTTDDKGKRDQYDLSWKDNIPEAKREVNKYNEKVEQATNTVTFSKKAENLDHIFDLFIEQTLESLKHEQIERTNERLSQILGLSEVQIESIEDSIQIEGKGGISEGQSLSVAYAYLSTLFEGSAVDMPFVIDSPAVSLDHKVRREVASIISRLFDQLIAFVISTEKEGFVDSLESRQHDGPDDIQYYTIHKTKTAGGVQKHTDETYFMQFTSEEEEEQGQSTAEVQ